MDESPTTPPCPRCRGPLSEFDGDLGTGSRLALTRDARICKRCGIDEAVRDATGLAAVQPGEWPMPEEHLTWNDAMRIGNWGRFCPGVPPVMLLD